MTQTWYSNPTSAAGAPVFGYAPRADADGYLPISICSGSAKSCTQGGVAQGLNMSGIAGARLQIPLGFIAHLYAITAYMPLAVPAGQTVTISLAVGASDKVAEWSALALTDTVTAGTSLPTTAPYVVDATSAEQRLSVAALMSAATGTLVVCGTIFGYMYRA